MNNSGNDIAKKVQDMIKVNNEKVLSSNSQKVARAHEASNKLVEKGILEKRGYTLRGIEDIHLLHLRPNT